MARSRRALHLGIAAVVVLLDQLTKAIVRSRFHEFGDSMTVIPGFFDLTRVHNTGAAFGMLNLADFPYKAVVMPLLAGGALVALALYALSLGDDQPLTRLGLSFIIGGAVGNLIDRVTYGYVLDFFDFYSGSWHFWAFNVADIAINVGVGFMILDLLGMGRHRVSRTV